jgi:hypothetical protein
MKKNTISQLAVNDLFSRYMREMNLGEKKEKAPDRKKIDKNVE